MPDVKGVLLPAYVLADESGSMGPYRRELSDGLLSLCESLRAEPMIAAKLRLAVLGFSADVQWLRGQGYKVHRPVVFFLSDGQPTDGHGWRTARATLVDRTQTQAAPNIIACGIGDAKPATMIDVATSEQFAFVAKPGVNIGAAI